MGAGKKWLTGGLAALTLMSGSGCFLATGGGKDSRVAQAKYDLANEAFQQARYRVALEHVDQALDEDEGHAEAAYLGGMVMLVFCAQDETSPDCRYERAEAFFRRALKAKPDMRDAKNALGVVLVHQKRPQEAVEVLEPLTRDILYRSPEKAWGNLGWALLRAGETDRALAALKRSVAAQPLFCVGHYRLGLAYEKKGQHASAHRALSRALEIDKGGCQRLQVAFLARARVAMQLGKQADARRDLERCQELAEVTEVGRECRTKLKSGL